MLMTSKLEKYLEKGLVTPNVDREQQILAIVVADSKGNHIRERLKYFDISTKVVWWCKGGGTTTSQFTYFSNHIEDVLKDYSEVVVYLWTGTCDITEKVRHLNSYGKYVKTNQIKLQNEDVQGVTDDLKQKYTVFSDFCKTLEGVTLVCLEIPFYSIQAWNETFNGQDKEEYKRQDKILIDIIISVNNAIRDVNRQNSVLSPKFATDVVNIRKSSGKPSQYTLNINLLSDGIHPIDILARVWLERLLIRIFIDCY